MHFFARFKVPIGFILLVILVGNLAFLVSTKLATSAAGIHSKVPARLGVKTSNCGAWNIISSPNIGTSQNILNSVAAFSTNNAWAVGYYNDNTSSHQTLIERWNGTTWSVIPSPNVGTNSNVLNAVTVISTNNAWTVGYYDNISQTLTEHWDGTRWSVVPSPNVGTNSNVLYAVTRVPGSNHLWAVGYYQNTGNSYLSLIEYWDGTTWSVVPSPNVGTDNMLNEVTAISANNVWAAGTSNNISAGVAQTLIEHWDGTSWKVVSSPNQGGSGSLHALTPIPNSNKLWGAGDYNPTSTSYQTLTEYWNGKNWSIVSSPNPGPEGSNTVIVLVGMTAVSARNVWAVGFYQYNNGFTPPQTLIEHWDGTSWSIVASPNPGSGSSLKGVVRVPGSTQFWAVGVTEILGAGNQTLIEYYC